ncbi:hypothetical protein GXM_05241 [Nostoc sphaeroides CCNUC1]|uniref:Uncharacterized protein n=1 Tax=Nostoc sphaeroides CCNUC1 TaxID=2653204 RepID=A0A5P8W6W8_9NOSO|nr:hypothetical protein GXM_05241 [Nostoc sphaeroides CCNUC1]
MQSLKMVGVFTPTCTSYEWDYRLWNVQSTSKAQDGFYSYRL